MRGAGVTGAMLTGTVKFVGPDADCASRDYKQPKVFLHISEVKEAGFDEIEKGQRWAFDVADGMDGRTMATNLDLTD